MTMTSYSDVHSWLIPTSLNTLVALLKNGTASFWLQECFPIYEPVRGHGHVPNVSEPERIMGCLPEYEDDYQVVILEVGPIRRLYERNNHWTHQIELGELRGVIPVSSRAKVRLRQLMPEIPFLEPYWAAAFEKEEQRRQLESRKLGGKAFLSLLGVDLDDTAITQRGQEISAMMLHSSVSERSTFLAHLVHYTRSLAVTKQDIGFFTDLGVILKEHLGKIELLSPLRALVKEHMDSTSDLPQLLPHFHHLHGSLSALSDTWYPSCVIYLKLKDELQNSGGYWRGLKPWARHLLEQEPEAFAEAALLAGYDFEFKGFAEAYRSWLREPKPAVTVPRPVENRCHNSPPPAPPAAEGRNEHPPAMVTPTSPGSFTQDPPQTDENPIRGETVAGVKDPGSTDETASGRSVPTKEAETLPEVAGPTVAEKLVPEQESATITTAPLDESSDSPALPLSVSEPPSASSQPNNDEKNFNHGGQTGRKGRHRHSK